MTSGWVKAGFVFAFMAAFTCSPTAEEATYYRPVVYKGIAQAKLIADIYRVLELYKQELPDMQALQKTAEQDKYFLADCFAKRIEITGRLVSYIKDMLKSSEPDALLYARQGKRELVELLNYFDEMKERQAFLKANPSEKVFPIKDFGAKGDGIQNDVTV